MAKRIAVNLVFWVGGAATAAAAAVSFPAQCTIVISTSGRTTIVGRASLPDGYALTSTYVGTLPCFGGTGKGHCDGERSGHRNLSSLTESAGPKTGACSTGVEAAHAQRALRRCRYVQERPASFGVRSALNVVAGERL